MFARILIFLLGPLVLCPAAMGQNPCGSAVSLPEFSCLLQLGPINLTVKRTIVGKSTDPLDLSTARALQDAVNYWDRTVQTELTPVENGTVLTLLGSQDSVSRISSLQGPPPGNTSYYLTPRYSFEVSIEDARLNDLAKKCVTVTINRPNGSAVVLTKPTTLSSKPNQPPACTAGEKAKAQIWNMSGDPDIERTDPPIVRLEITGISNPSKPNSPCESTFDSVTSDVQADAAYQWFQYECSAEYVIARVGQAFNTRLVLGMSVEKNDESAPTLSIKEDLLKDTTLVFSVNGDQSIRDQNETSIDQAFDGTWTIDWRVTTIGCRLYPADDSANAPLVVRSRVFQQFQTANGIVVGWPKIFDVASLQRMLDATATQLAAISGFNPAPINAAIGNLQGITRETSYVNAQLTTAPTPSLNTVTTSGTTTPNQTQTTTPNGPTTVTLQCPDGSLPTIGGSGTLGGCTTVPVSGTGYTGTSGAPVALPGYAPVSGSGAPFTGTLTTTPSSSSSNTSYSGNSQTQSTTANQSVSGAVPAAIAATPIAAPTNVGVGSADILAEQVQLNSQITTLRLLLQGALSDQYLLKNSRAVGERLQTTLGFTVAIDPPRQYKHAIAEIRIYVVPTKGNLSPSIMTLLPLEKTYNVAKVTSNQRAFGGGAVIEPVSVGFSTGKSKDRLYLAKDTDTIALQFPLPILKTSQWPNGFRRNVPTPLPQKLGDLAKSAVEFQAIGDCEKDQTYAAPHARLESDVDYATNFGLQPVSFGWQFRPVLGADYVQGGERQVFAQLALGAGLGETYNPNVYIETRWREYDPDTQVVGAVYSDACSIVEVPSDVAIINQPAVRNVSTTDMGSGQLKLTATGNFFTSSLSVLSGQSALSTVFFDGKAIEVFGNAHDLIEAGDLKLVGQNGQNTPFAIAVDTSKSRNDVCGITASKLRAIPRPDGNSVATLDLTIGANFMTHGEDGEPRPLVLIGSQVYGLRESPFLNEPGTRCDSYLPTTCRYRFIAPTTTLRNAQTFDVRDFAWEQMASTGHIEFLPSFTSVKALAAGPQLIVTQPATQEVQVGETATFSVEVASGVEVNYRWFKNGKSLDDATSPSYTSPAATKADNGAKYSVVLSYSEGNLTSSTAVLQVDDNPPAQPKTGGSPKASGSGIGSGSKTNDYEISGFDFTRIGKSCDPNKKPFTDPCLKIYVDSGKKDVLDSINFEVVNDNTAIVRNIITGAKTLRFLLYSDLDGDNKPIDSGTVEWDVSIPKSSDESSANVVGSPAFLYMGDSQTVSFSSSSLSNLQDPVTVTFEGKSVLGATFDKNKKVLNVPIATSITSLPGHKELSIDVPSDQPGGNPQTVKLTFDVIKQIIKE